MTRTKICGLTTVDDVAAAVNAGADAVGFVVDVPVDTPREISAARAASLVAEVPPLVTTVLVTMPSSPRDAIDLARRVGADAVQVHNDMTDGDLAYLASKVDARVIKTVSAARPTDARQYDDVADALLVDSTDAAGAGGTGRTHDWTVTADLARTLSSPVLLAGGLTPENVAEVVETVGPYAVDVATGVEASGGRKDHDAVARFVENATRRPQRIEP